MFPQDLSKEFLPGKLFMANVVVLAFGEHT